MKNNIGSYYSICQSIDRDERKLTLFPTVRKAGKRYAHTIWFNVHNAFTLYCSHSFDRKDEPQLLVHKARLPPANSLARQSTEIRAAGSTGARAGRRTEFWRARALPQPPFPPDASQKPRIAAAAWSCACPAAPPPQPPHLPPLARRAPTTWVSPPPPPPHTLFGTTTSQGWVVF